MPFAHRRDAGRRLAAELRRRGYGGPDLAGPELVVLGLPRGGVPVAYEVATALGADLDVIVVRKLGVPHQPELAMGAIGEGGARVLNPEVIRITGVSAEAVDRVETAERTELDRRVRRLRGIRGRVPLTGRVAIIVDDGIATGSTALAACRVARSLGARRVVVATPVAPPDVAAMLEQVADEVVCVELPARFDAVGVHYEDFSQISDDEVARLLEQGVAAGTTTPGGAPTGRLGPPDAAAGAGSVGVASVGVGAVVRTGAVAGLVAETVERFDSVEGLELGPLLERIGECPLVLLGEASHGTSEFHRIRDRITRALIERKGFTVVAVEADWPDAATVDRHVRDRPDTGSSFEAFARFPTWMWRNHEVAAFVSWLRDHNRSVAQEEQTSFCGLDLYSLYTSRAEVLAYLERVDPEAATVARDRYSCLSPWLHRPEEYGRAVVTGAFAGCEADVTATLTDLLRRRFDDPGSSEDLLDATRNAAVVADAERYYRVMYRGSRASWNLRDQHMFDTLESVRATHGPGTKVVVWEHNSHVGDASATEMGTRGEHNLGMLCRRRYGDDAYLVGFGTDSGTVAAASDWGGPMAVKVVRPSRPDSYERVFHDAGVTAGFLHLRHPVVADVRPALAQPRLERAIGVIYRPETERQSHYFGACLPDQFDEYVWIDRTTAVHPGAGPVHALTDEPETYPSGL